MIIEINKDGQDIQDKLVEYESDFNVFFVSLRLFRG